MNDDLKIVLLLLGAAVLFVCLGLWAGHVITQKRDLVVIENLVKASIEKNTREVYTTGFADGVLLSDKFHIVGIADWCNLDIGAVEIQCNYPTKNDCDGYLESKDQVCVENLRNKK